MSLAAEPIVPASRSLRVLVVEDEPRWRELLVEVLPEMGFAARGVRSAEEALTVMEADPHDILILDLHLPAMSGIDCFERVRDLWPTTQGIILTAYGELAAAQKAIRLRVAEFLTKPCHLADIELALERARKLVVAARDTEVAERTTVAPGGTLKDAEKLAILEAMARNLNNKAATARELGISRRSLYDRLAEMRYRG